jgi:hypothetical protein
VTAPRKTQRIPRSQRIRLGREFTLSPEAIAHLEKIPARERSAYVDALILKDAKRKRRTS